MSLRVRFAVLTSAIVLVLAGSTAFGAYRIASMQLHGEVDRSLESRAARLVDLLARPAFRPGDVFGRDVRDEILATELDSITQLDIPGTGPVGRRGNPVIPSTPRDNRMSESGGGRRWSEFSAGGVDYRVLTVAVPDGTLVRVAKDTAVVDRALGSMRIRLPLSTALAAFLAAVVGWWFARRITRPVENLAATAESIAATQDLDQPIEQGGAGEVGALARSFGAMVEALRSSLARQRQLVQDASHELRTPLTSLRANTEILERANLSDDERRSVLADMRAEVDELAALSAELGALATDHRATEEAVPVNLVDIAADVVERARRRTTMPITLETGDNTIVVARPHQLERAVSNLVDNAVKFSAGAGEVTVVIRDSAVEVRDRGPGIPDEDKPRVFDRFYRALNTRSMPGSGLGLAIVSQCAEDNDAETFVRDNEGGGAVVGIRFR
ncbi:MAG: HAMP domain-containing sensor histidine kinase [Ilumatobacteraceae bacterium]